MDQQAPVITMVDVGDAWIARLPVVGETRVEDPRLAAWALGELIPGGHHPKLPGEVRLVDEEGEVLHPFLLLFNDYSGRDKSAVYELVRANLPQGCHWAVLDGYPALWCLRRGADRLDAIEEVIKEVRRHGITTELNDLGMEKLWEWRLGDEFCVDMVAQLLLMAAHRAELAAIPPERLIGLLRTASKIRPE
ncbi:hypothetical protein ACFXJ8_30615 [Nonomuraea sp. NPDC059194]|uniref:hypothetical protein n=1 Tax=Nonomuraea sp. NPDC059194 TaxID=3346764 RepID=UPI0036C2A4B3